MSVADAFANGIESAWREGREIDHVELSTASWASMLKEVDDLLGSGAVTLGDMGVVKTFMGVRVVKNSSLENGKLLWVDKAVWEAAQRTVGEQESDGRRTDESDGPASFSGRHRREP